MTAREKIIGIVLILIGTLPFLLKIEPIGNLFTKYTFLSYLAPGEIIYQIVLIIIGLLLLLRRKSVYEY